MSRSYIAMVSSYDSISFWSDDVFATAELMKVNPPHAIDQPIVARMKRIGLKVGESDDELRDAVSRLKDAGATIVGASDHTVTHSVYVLDPDGNEVELYVDVPGVDWRSDPSLVLAPIRPLTL